MSFRECDPAQLGEAILQVLPRLTISQAHKALFHKIDLSEIALQAVCAAKLAGRRAEAPGGECLASFRSAQMNHGGELLFLDRAGFDCATGRQGIHHSLMQIGGGQFDGMARQRSGIETVEPAGTRIWPRLFARHLMIANAILARLGKSAVGELKHAECAGSRTIDLQGVPRPLPAPVGARHGITVALDLRQRSEQFRRHYAGRILFKQRAVTLPRGRGIFCEGAADRGEELTGLAYYLIDQVKCEERGQTKNTPPDDASFPQEFGKTPERPSPAVSHATKNSRCHGKRLTPRRFCIKRALCFLVVTGLGTERSSLFGARKWQWAHDLGCRIRTGIFDVRLFSLAFPEKSCGTL